MPSYSIRILRSATRDLEKIDKSTAFKIVQKIYWLAENLETLKPTALKGQLSGLFKLREGDYRIIDQILRKERTILIHAVGHLSDIYKGS